MPNRLRATVSFEDIEELNPPGARGGFSVLRHLLDVGAAWPALLCDAAAVLRSVDAPAVLCFFQLPYDLALEKGWYRLKVPGEPMHVELRVVPAVVEATDDLRFRVGPVASATSALRAQAPIAQGMLLVYLQAKRARFHERYLEAIERGARGAIVVPAAESWTPGHKPLTAVQYEMDVARRIHLAVVGALRLFLPAYSICALREAPVPREVAGYFVMLQSLRVVRHIAVTPIVHQLLSDLATRSESKRVAGGELERALAAGLRETRPFEQQLFAMERLRRDGEPALALIGVIAATEWLANQFVKSCVPELIRRKEHQVALSTCLKSRDYQAVFGSLSDAVRAILIDSLTARHALVHGPPPRRHSTAAPSRRAGRELADVTPTQDTDSVFRTIGAAFEFYRWVNIEAQRRSAKHGTRVKA